MSAGRGLRYILRVRVGSLLSGLGLGLGLGLGCGGSVSDGTSDAALDSAADGFAFDSTRDDVRFDAPGPFDATATCPATKPTSGTACGPARLSCTYAGSCGDDFAQCVDGTWTVTAATCPSDFCSTKGPTPGGACKTEGFVCEYPLPFPGEFATCTVCTCKGSTYFCEEHPIAECPLPTCKTGDACTTPGMIGCEYGGRCGTSCRCETSGKLTCATRLC